MDKPIIPIGINGPFSPEALAQREFSTFGDAWLTQLARLVTLGRPTSPRDLATLELCGEAFTVRDLRACLLLHPVRDLPVRFALAEFLWILSGSRELAPIRRYNQKLSHFSDDGEHLAGAYGPRLAEQWAWIIGCLKKPDTRQAVATIWTPAPAPSKDVPCTVAVQWLVRNERLNAIVSMRSSDVWLGLPFDFYCFAQLTNWLACQLGLDTGWLRYELGSSHLYNDKLEQAKRVLASGSDTMTLRWPRFTEPMLPSEAAKLLAGDYPQREEHRVFANVLACPTREAARRTLLAWATSGMISFL
jgi:thymidylate synthase